MQPTAHESKVSPMVLRCSLTSLAAGALARSTPRPRAQVDRHRPFLEDQRGDRTLTIQGLACPAGSWWKSPARPSPRNTLQRSAPRPPVQVICNRSLRSVRERQPRRLPAQAALHRGRRLRAQRSAGERPFSSAT